MCGIAGQVSYSGQVDMAALHAMSAAGAHRGPDDAGIWQSPDGLCGLAHRRLSVIDLSAAGHQPMLDPDTGTALVFNGEIYNHAVLRKSCEARGYQFHSHTDTEVILALYRFHGVECLSLLRGMFAIALWDAKRRQLFLARDRVGKKPLHYAVSSSGILFSSEIDPLAQHRGVSREMDLDALDLYFYLQYIPDPWTIYCGIRKLPPAHYAIFDDHGFRIQQYWEVDYRKKIRISEADALDALQEKLTEAIRLRMVADVPLGALLSGGVDSSVIVALMSSLSDRPIQTFSMGFDEATYSELPFAKQVADLCKTDHHPEIAIPHLEDDLPLIARRYGEPFADSSAVPSFAVCRTARRHVTVVMNGDGGDELLGGYPRYWIPDPVLRAASLFANWPGRGDDPVPSIMDSYGGGRLSRFWGAFLRNVLLPDARSLTMYHSAFWGDPDRANLIGRLPSESSVPGWRGSWFGNASAHGNNPIDRMLWMDNRTYLSGDLLVKMDIASMHCGLEARSPFLDHELIEFSASLPYAYKVRGGVGKYLLKKLAERYFPVDFVHRPKMGFGIPLTEWLRGPLQPMLRRLLLDRRLMEPLDPAMVKRVYDELQAGNLDHGPRAWTLLMFGLWKEQCFSR